MKQRLQSSMLLGKVKFVRKNIGNLNISELPIGLYLLQLNLDEKIEYLKFQKHNKMIRFFCFIFILFHLNQNCFCQEAERKYDDPSKNTHLSYPNFDLIIFDYEVYSTPYDKANKKLIYPDSNNLSIGFDKDSIIYLNVKKDTVALVEWVFNVLGKRRLQIISKNKSDQYKISFCVQESIHEQFNMKTFYKKKFKNYKAEEKAYELWAKNAVKWIGTTKYQSLKDSANGYFILPKIDIDDYETIRKKTFHLKDTLVNLSGESDNIATLIYKKKPCLYSLNRAFLRIERLVNEKVIEIKYLEVIFSYGC
jgi:hypothetical protein